MSSLSGKETEKEEYERLLEDRLKLDAYLKEDMEDFIKKYVQNHQSHKEKRLQNLEEKFNPNKDKPSISYKDNLKRIAEKRIYEEQKKKITKIITLKKQNPKISLEEAILRTFGSTRNIYEDDEIIKLFKLEKYPPNAPPLPSPPKRSSPKKSKSKLTKEGLELAKSKLKPKSPPKPPPLPSPPKRSSPKKSKSKLTKEGLELAKTKLKPKGPPYPPPLPSPPKRSSPKKSSPKSKLTKENLEMAKSKLKHSQINLKPDNPDYDLEMAFRNLEK